MHAMSSVVESDLTRLAIATKHRYARAMASVWFVQLLTLSSCNLVLVLPRVLKQQGVGLAWQGWIMATFNMAYLAGLLSGGQAIRRRGYRAPTLAAGILVVAGCLLYSAGKYSILAHFAARGLHGFGTAIVLLAWQNRVVVIADVSRRGKALGMTNLLGFVALAISPMVGESIQRLGRNDVVFLAAAAVCVPVVLLGLRLPAMPERNRAFSAKTNDRQTTSQWAALILVFCHSAAQSSAQLLLPLITGGKAGWAFSGFFLAYGTSALLSRSWIEPRLHLRSPPLLLVATECLVPLGAMLLMIAGSTPAFVIIGVLFGFGHGMFFPTTVQLITHDAPVDQLVNRVVRLAALAVFGMMIGECSAGLMARFIGVNAAMGIGGTVVLVAQLAMLPLISRSAKGLRVPMGG